MVNCVCTRPIFQDLKEFVYNNSEVRNNLQDASDNDSHPNFSENQRELESERARIRESENPRVSERSRERENHRESQRITENHRESDRHTQTIFEKYPWLDNALQIILEKLIRLFAYAVKKIIFKMDVNLADLL